MCTIIGTRKGVLPFGNVFQGFTWIQNRYHCLNDKIEPRKKCQGCDYEKVCGGGCPATNVQETASVYIPDDIVCKFGLISRRIDHFFRCCHDEIFDTIWTLHAETLCKKGKF
jgi:radical SAM protein with 4Fe4S-binding SPASM domain